jgi:hypothetical protein
MAELFADFEVNREPRWDRVLKLFGGSLALHLLVLICVLYIPGLRAAFNIATLIADTSFVEKPYARTEIGDVQLVELSSEKFHYPEGYFASEAQMGALTPPPLPQFVAQARPPINFSADIQPSPNLSPTATPSPSPAPSASGSPVETAAQAKATPIQKYEGDKLTAEEAQTELETTAAKNHIELPKEGEINKQVLKDFAAEALKLKNQGRLDLDKPFEVVIESELDEHGKLKNPKFTKKSGDANLVELSGRMIAALNDSGFLIYLKRINEDNPGTIVVFTVKQNQTEIVATVESDASSSTSARQLSLAFNLLLASGAKSREGKDEEMLLKNTSVSPDGRRIKFNFAMPRQPVVELIKKSLAS